MNNVIKPVHLAPVVGYTVIGPAAPTVAEGKLREDYEKLRAAYDALLQEAAQELNDVHSRITAVESQWHRRLSLLEMSAHARLAALETRWYHKVRDWFRKAFSCR